MEGCIFCKISKGEIPAPKLYEDDAVFCIKDIHSQAKAHLLVIPKKHVASLNEVYPEEGQAHGELMGRLFAAATRVAREQGLHAKGFRTVINTGPDAGQTVFHLHVHVLGGEPLDGFGA